MLDVSKMKVSWHFGDFIGKLGCIFHDAWFFFSFLRPAGLKGRLPVVPPVAYVRVMETASPKGQGGGRPFRSYENGDADFFCWEGD